MLLCSFTSERALCLLRLRLDSPLSADSKWGIFRYQTVAHPPQNAAWCRLSARTPNLLNLLYQPSGAPRNVRRLDVIGYVLAGTFGACVLERVSIGGCVIALALSSCCVADVCNSGSLHPSI
jgi:hypothetical protein